MSPAKSLSQVLIITPQAEGNYSFPKAFFFQKSNPTAESERREDALKLCKVFKKMDPVFLSVLMRCLFLSELFFTVLTIHMTVEELTDSSLFLDTTAVRSQIIRKLICRFAPETSALYF